MIDEIKTKGKGLLPLPVDPRDHSHAQVFGSVMQESLPTNDFIVAPAQEIKNQDINYDSDYCTSYGASAVCEDEDAVPFVPEWLFAQAKKILALKQGSQVYDSFGLNLRDICNAVISAGLLPRLYDPYHCDSLNRPSRDILVHAENWSKFGIDYRALPYKKASYFTVDGPHDTFDNMRSVMWIKRAEKRSILTGCMWRASWSNASDGIIPDTYEDQGSGHAFKICGQKIINEEVRLVAQLSDGVEFGDKGYFYFTREQINKEFGAFGAFTFSQLPVVTAKKYLNCGITVNDSCVLKMLKLINNSLHL